MIFWAVIKDGDSLEQFCYHWTYYTNTHKRAQNAAESHAERIALSLALRYRFL